MEAKRPGGDTVLGDIVRMVEDAQTREAPVQRLVDNVIKCTHFIYAKGMEGSLIRLLSGYSPLFLISTFSCH